MDARIEQAECLDWLARQADNSVDLVLCSPPYEAARTYGIEFNLRGQEWVDWAVERYIECCRISRGLVVWVVEGQTRQFRWSATPALLMSDLHRAGVKLRKPPIFHRAGICGSGGPDWLRNDYEFCVCASKGRLPWSDNTAMGHPPKWGPGGAMSYRLTTGQRVNQWGGRMKRDGSHYSTEFKSDTVRNGRTIRPSHRITRISKNTQDNTAIANPGNVIRCTVGGGQMGDNRAHENEAPFPEKLAEFFVLSFCPPGGTVCDIFSGSGTTAAVALKNGRNFIGCDIRESQVELTRRRTSEVQPTLFAEAQ